MLDKAEAIESTHLVQVFCNGSGFAGGIGASAVLFVNNQVTETLHYHLGSDTKHTVYKAEGVGVAMALGCNMGTGNSTVSQPQVP